MDIPGVAASIVYPKDDRIYEDSKGRPVGLAAVLNSVTNTLERPELIPLMTPEDKRMLNTLFERCIDHAETCLRSHRQSAKKKSPYHHGLSSYSSREDIRRRFGKSLRPLSPYTDPADRNSGSDKYPAQIYPPEPSRQDIRQASAVYPAVTPPQPAQRTPNRR